MVYSCGVQKIHSLSTRTVNHILSTKESQNSDSKWKTSFYNERVAISILSMLTESSKDLKLFPHKYSEGRWPYLQMCNVLAQFFFPQFFNSPNSLEEIIFRNLNVNSLIRAEISWKRKQFFQKATSMITSQGGGYSIKLARDAEASAK